MYVLDSNFLIIMKNDMPVDSAEHTDFWELLLRLAQKDYLKLPEMVIEEITKGSDSLAEWVKANKKDLIIKTDAIYEKLPIVLAEYEKGINGMPLDNLDLLDTNADPYVISHALALNAIVVSSEKPCKGDYLQMSPKNRKIPDVCNALGIKCIPNLKFLLIIAKLSDADIENL
jgi:hypothetical protein